MKALDYKVEDRYGKEVLLRDEYEGKVLLILNSATQCGFTPQYSELQDLYEKYVEKGFVILDFPCNQFGSQAPGSIDEIITFCDANYGVTFPTFAKVEVNGENAHPLFKYLKSQKGFQGFDPEHKLTPVLDKRLSEEDVNYKDDPSIKWNFTKFLVDRDGNLVERYEPTTGFDVIENRLKELL